MKKLTRKSLDELAKIYPVLSDEEQRGYVAGASPTGSVTGTADVCGLGGCEMYHSQSEHYIDPVVITPGGSGSYNGGGGSPSGISPTGNFSDNYYNGVNYGLLTDDHNNNNNNNNSTHPPAGGGGGVAAKLIGLSFGVNADASTISAYSRSVIQRAFESGTFAITSTTRTVSDQARIMYENIERTGVSKQLEIYGEYGDRVINVYDAHKSRAENLTLMEMQINAEGAINVSAHLRDQAYVNVLDIALSSVPDLTVFRNYLDRCDGVSYRIENKCIHIEIKQK